MRPGLRSTHRPTLVAYLNKTETLILDDRLYIYIPKQLNLDGLRVQKVPYMKFSVIIKWGQVCQVPAGQKGSLPTLVAYPNKTESFISDDRPYVKTAESGWTGVLYEIFC